MTSRSVYLGDPADEEFQLDGGNSSGNFPRQLGPAWPRNRRGEHFTQWGVYSIIVAEAMSGKFEGRQTDWGCWVTLRTRDELLAFLDECYGDGPIYPPDWTIRGKIKEDHEIRHFVAGLDQNRKYYLVAMES